LAALALTWKWPDLSHGLEDTVLEHIPGLLDMLLFYNFSLCHRLIVNVPSRLPVTFAPSNAVHCQPRHVDNIS